MSDHPTPADVLDGVWEDAVRTAEEEKDTTRLEQLRKIGHFAATIVDMPEEEFLGDTPFETEIFYRASTNGRDIRVEGEHAPRCFIGNAIVKAPSAFTDFNLNGPNTVRGLEFFIVSTDVVFTAHTYGLPLKVVQHIYIGVAGLTFASAKQFAADTMNAFIKDEQPPPLPDEFDENSVYEFVDDHE